MDIDLAQRAGIVFGLAFDIEKAPERPSGFKPAHEHLGSSDSNPMYAEPRLEGFAAMLRLGYCKKLVLSGKTERRYKDEEIWQGAAIREMLIKDLGCSAETVISIPSVGATSSAAVAFREFGREHDLTFGWGEAEFCTSFYHCVRTTRVALRSAGLPPFLTPAEAFTMAEAIAKDRANEAEQRLRSFGGHLADPRIILELRGIALELLGKYQIQRRGW